MRRRELFASLFAPIIVATVGCSATAPSRPAATTQGILLLASPNGTGPLIAQRDLFSIASAWIIDSDRVFTLPTGGLTITSSNPTVLRPSSGGLYQAGNAGTASLLGTYLGFSASLPVTVIDPSTPYLQVFLSDSPRLTAQATVRSAVRVSGSSTQSVTPTALTLQSRTLEIATVQNGVITWQRPGNAEIVYTLNGESTTIVYGVPPRFL